MYRVEIGGQSTNVAKWNRKVFRMCHIVSCIRVNICVIERHSSNIRVSDDWIS